MQGLGTYPELAALLRPVSAAVFWLGPLERAPPLASESQCDGEAVMQGGMVGTAGAPGIREEGWGYLPGGWEQVAGRAGCRATGHPRA